MKIVYVLATRHQCDFNPEVINLMSYYYHVMSNLKYEFQYLEGLPLVGVSRGSYTVPQ